LSAHPEVALEVGSSQRIGARWGSDGCGHRTTGSVALVADSQTTYRYQRPSGLEEVGDGVRATLSTSSAALDNPWFFEGSVQEPDLVAAMLLGVARVARSRFTMSSSTLAAMRDPVATANAGVLRFESFSQCNGVYARFDYPLDEWSSDLQRDVGTTNVDFNEEMIGALSRVGRDSAMILSVGEQAVAVETVDGEVVERRVPLSERWVRGFGEAAVSISDLDLSFEVTAAALRSFVRSVSKRPPKGTLFLTGGARELRLSTRSSNGSASIGSPERVAPIEPLVPFVKRAFVYGSNHPGSPIVWDLELVGDTGARFTLALSPEAYRGFSGEGNVLHALTGLPDTTVDAVRDSLCWQPALDEAALASALHLDTASVRSALVALAAAGLVGFDVHRGSYFHRELPYELEDAVRLHPRLRSAEKTLARDGVVRVNSDGAVEEYLVGNGESEHLVRLHDTDASCTCTWWFRYRGERGPCQHVTAARLARSRSAATEANSNG